MALAAQVGAARHAVDAARLRVNAARLDGNDAARSYRELALGANDRFGKLQERRKSIAQVRGLYREQYKLGTRSILDLLNAEQEYYQAAFDESSAQHDHWAAVIDYVAATGAGNRFYGLESRSVQGVEIE